MDNGDVMGARPKRVHNDPERKTLMRLSIAATSLVIAGIGVALYISSDNAPDAMGSGGVTPVRKLTPEANVYPTLAEFLGAAAAVRDDYINQEPGYYRLGLIVMLAETRTQPSTVLADRLDAIATQLPSLDGLEPVIAAYLDDISADPSAPTLAGRPFDTTTKTFQIQAGDILTHFPFLVPVGRTNTKAILEVRPDVPRVMYDEYLAGGLTSLVSMQQLMTTPSASAALCALVPIDSELPDIGQDQQPGVPDMHEMDIARQQACAAGLNPGGNQGGMAGAFAHVTGSSCMAEILEAGDDRFMDRRTLDLMQCVKNRQFQYLGSDRRLVEATVAGDLVHMMEGFSDALSNPTSMSDQPTRFSDALKSGSREERMYKLKDEIREEAGNIAGADARIVAEQDLIEHIGDMIKEETDPVRIDELEDQQIEARVRQNQAIQDKATAETRKANAEQELKEVKEQEEEEKEQQEEQKKNNNADDSTTLDPDPSDGDCTEALGLDALITPALLERVGSDGLIPVDPTKVRPGPNDDFGVDALNFGSCFGANPHSLATKCASDFYLCDDPAGCRCSSADPLNDLNNRTGGRYGGLVRDIACIDARCADPGAAGNLSTMAGLMCQCGPEPAIDQDPDLPNPFPPDPGFMPRFTNGRQIDLLFGDFSTMKATAEGVNDGMTTMETYIVPDVRNDWLSSP